MLSDPARGQAASRATVALSGASSMLSKIDRRFRRLALMVALACLAGAGSPVSLVAQDEEDVAAEPVQQEAPVAFYEIREINGQPIAKPKPSERTRILAILREGQLPPEDQALWDSYWLYRVAEFTWPESLPNLPKLRDTLKKQELLTSGGAPSPQLHAALVELLRERFYGLATRPEYHPTVRLNAMLVVGDLNETEPNVQGQGAVPLPRALQDLFRAVNNSDNDELQQPDFIRVAAMVGLLRHAQLNVADQARGPIVQLMLQLIAPQAAENATPTDAEIWLCRQAIRVAAVLASKYSEVNTADLALALRPVLNNPVADLQTRCLAARALGYLEATGFEAGEVPDLVYDLADLLVAVANNKPRAASTVEESPAAEAGGIPGAMPGAAPGMPGGAPGMPGGMPGMPGGMPGGGRGRRGAGAQLPGSGGLFPGASGDRDEEDDRPQRAKPQPRYWVENTKYFLASVRYGLGMADLNRGVYPAAGQESQQRILELQAQIDRMLKLLGSSSTPEAELSEQLLALGQEVVAWLDANAPAAVDADAEAAGDARAPEAAAEEEAVEP